MLGAPPARGTREPSARVRSWPSALLAAGAAVVAVAVVWLVVRHPVASRLDRGLTVVWFDTTVPTFRAEPLSLVDRWTHVIATLAAVVTLITVRNPGFWRRFWLAPASPIDLAVLRVVIFGVLAVLPRVREAVQLSALPDALRTPRAGMPWLLDVLPAVTPEVVRPLALAFVVVCLLACAGWWTRPSAICAVVLGLVLLAIPQSYGKVTHFHHLWWIAAVLAASRCGDALSLDAARRAWRRGDGAAPTPRPSAAYGLPLRLTWLLIATTYLFPGIWKYASAGWSWAFSDNVRTIMYEHWTRLDGFAPLLPIDQWPLAYRAGGAAVIVFEIFFVVLVLGRRTRPLAAVAGLAFHNANYLFLRLSFATLQITYVAFVPWSRLFAWLGERVPYMTVEAGTPRQLRRLGALRALDPIGVVRDRPADARRPVSALSPDGTARGGPGVVAVVGVLLLSANALAGVGAVTSAWPFACYPTFAGLARTDRAELVLLLVHPDGTAREVDAAELRRLVSWEKLDSMARPIVEGDPDARERTAALLDAAVAAGLRIPPGTTVTAFREDVPLDPQATPTGVRERLLVLTR